MFLSGRLGLLRQQSLLSLSLKRKIPPESNITCSPAVLTQIFLKIKLPLHFQNAILALRGHSGVSTLGMHKSRVLFHCSNKRLFIDRFTTVYMKTGWSIKLLQHAVLSQVCGASCPVQSSPVQLQLISGSS